MPPVISRLKPFPLPYDVLRMIALLIPREQLKDFIISCKSCHMVGAALLYRSVEAWVDPLNHENLPYTKDNRPVRFLLTLVNSTLLDPKLDLPSRRYADHLVAFSYGSWSTACDLRALPLLAEALRFTPRLRHLRLDVPSGSVPVLLDIFRRSSIIITPSTMLPCTHSVDRLPLSCLRSVRTSRISIADAFMQYRSIQTVAVDLSVKWAVLAKFLRAEPPWTPTHLQQLAIHIAGYPVAEGLVEGILIAFPRLQHLAIRVTAVRAPELLRDALRVLTQLPPVGQSLRALSVNHGSVYANYAAVLENHGRIFAEGFPMRPALREVVMGMSLWARTTVNDGWLFRVFDDLYLDKWAWLENRNEGEWAKPDETVKAYHLVD